MRLTMLGFIVFGWFASPASAADRLDELFAEWEKLPSFFQSLVVDFGLEVYDPVSGTVERSSGELRLIRTAKGELLGSYEIRRLGGRDDNAKASFY